MSRWVMVIDLEKCTGCQTCTVACKVFYALGPTIQHVTVFEKEIGEYPDVKRVYIPRRCMNCGEPQCVEVCPTGATYKADDGIVMIDKNKCMGCRYCVLSCPYNARVFYGKELTYHGKPSMWESERYSEHVEGVVTKCDFCKTRLEDGMSRNLKPGQDDDATPMCVISCIAKALTFGDIEDPESEVSKLIKDRKGFQLHEDIGTDPSVYYLPRRY